MTVKPTKAQLALEYAGRGWHVFPIAAGTKDRPLCYWGKEATCDAAIVAQWWRRYPDANIGLAVGKSGLAVIDLDDKPSKVKGMPPKEGSKRWEELEFDHGIAPDTFTVRTPSGGTHLYFSGSVTNSVDKLAEGVDTRGSGGMGGYVLAAGSSLGAGDQEKFYTVVAEAAVAPVPEWVTRLAGVKADRTENQGRVEVDELDRPDRVAWARNHLAVDARVAVSGHGGNQRTYRVACECRDKGLSEETAYELMAELYNPRCEPPWTDGEIRQFAKNAYSYAAVVGVGGDTAEAHFGGADGFGKAGEPPSIEEFADRGARPLATSSSATATGPSGGGGTSDDEVRSFLDQWVWVIKTQMFVRRKDKFDLGEKSFDSMYGFMGEKGKVVSSIMSSNSMMRKFELMQFLPGEPEFAGRFYNGWTEPRVKPAEGDTAVFHEHMERLLPDEAERKAAVDWMAWVVQYESLKPNFMFLMQGEQGCGKSVLGVLMSRMVDERNTTFLRTEDVGNRFNSWVMRTRLGVVEELMGDDKRGLANHMKALITQDTITCEPKGKDLFTTPNKVAFMAFTNHLDALRLENSDRRYMVFRTAAKGLGTPDAYWTRLWSFVRSDACVAAVLHELLRRDVHVDFGLGRAPHTRAHEEMRREGLPEVERWMIENHEDRNPPFAGDLVTVEDVIAHLPDKMRKIATAKMVGGFLRDELKAAMLGAHRIPGGSSSKRIWAIRRGELYAQMPSRARVERYLKTVVGAADFNDDEDDMAVDQADPLA